MNAYRGPLAWGQVELSSRVLTFDAVSSMLVQILPAHQQQALTEFGAIEHEIPSPTGVDGRFTVIAARGGEDVWLEVRRRPIEIEAAESPEAVPQAEQPVEHVAVSQAHASEPDADPVQAAAVSSEAAAVDESTAVESAHEPLAEPAPHAEHEIELVGEEESLVDSPAVPEVLPEDIESIVVAIPGQEAEEIQLDGVPDNAIQIIDDEPQGVPTEEEVDAMLAATATALLTSGLGDDAVENEGRIELRDPALEAEREETPVVLKTEGEAFAIDVDASIAEPGFELSPPPALARADDEVSEDADVIADAPLGTPLFSDEAVLAAAAVPVPEVAIEEAPVGPVSVVGGVPAVEEYAGCRDGRSGRSARRASAASRAHAPRRTSNHRRDVAAGGPGTDCRDLAGG